jgi:hypothetical protein
MFLRELLPAPKPTIKFSLSAEQNYNFTFNGNGGFHSTTNSVFNTPWGLKIPDKIEIAVEYGTPAAFWRGLPQELKERITAFSFNGKL